MMSQNRQDAKDRARCHHDCKVNFKAGPEIRHLHERMDFRLKHQAQRLFALQELQIGLVEEFSRHHVPDANTRSAANGHIPAPDKATHPPKSC